MDQDRKMFPCREPGGQGVIIIKKSCPRRGGGQSRKAPEIQLLRPVVNEGD